MQEVINFSLVTHRTLLQNGQVNGELPMNHAPHRRGEGLEEGKGMIRYLTLPMGFDTSVVLSAEVVDSSACEMCNLLIVHPQSRGCLVWRS